jgi:uncharacterized membrane protein
MGEWVGDKLPNIPNRTDPPGVMARTVSGILAGASIARLNGKSRLRGAMVGAAAAFIGTYAAYHARRWAGQRYGLPDPLVGMAEDALAFGSGSVLVRLSQPSAPPASR